MIIWGVPEMGVPLYRWMVPYGNLTNSWMITRGTPHDLGNLHMFVKASKSSMSDRFLSKKQMVFGDCPFLGGFTTFYCIY